MHILSPLREQQQQQQQYKDDNRGGDHHHQMESFSIGGGNVVDFSEFSGGNLLDSIDFDDLFIGIDSEMDVLPDLEMDSDMLADFSLSGESELNTSPVSLEKWVDDEENLASFTINTVEEFGEREEDHDQNHKVDSSGSGTTDLKYSSSDNSNSQGGRDEIVCKGDEIAQSGGGGVNDNTATSSPKEATTDKGHRKSSSSSAQSKTSHAKRKVKVDWTPELHRRFVQAVEQLGVDKAVPSRILELMGIDCLTRHNIASHLQKYRSHRKHLLAREAEAASWTRRRQFASAGGGRIGVKRPSPEMGRWLAPPTMGFPPPPPPPPMHQQQHHGHHHQFRPLHVWGHPTVDQSVMHKWPPKHLALFSSPQPPPPTWPPAPSPQTDTSSSYWHHHHQRHVPPNGVVTPGTPCFPRQIATPPATRFPGAPVTVIPPHPHGGMYKLDPAGQSVGAHHPLVDFQPSKESIDAAIGDALSKPWLPLPLGLKPPSTDSVMGELQQQGIPNIPPSTAA